MKVVLRSKKDNGKYRYLHEDNGIIVKTFYNEKEAFKFLYERSEELLSLGKKDTISEYGWECINFQKFQEELSRNGAIVQN